MAISAPTERYAQSRTGQTATTTFSPTGTITTGKFLVIQATTSTDGKVPSSVTDDAGNTWSVDLAYNPGTSPRNVAFVSCQVTAQLTTSSVITINWAVSTSNQAHIWLQEFTGIVTSSAFDKSATGDATSGSTITTGSSGTLSQANELVVVGVRGDDITGWAPGATYTAVTTSTLGAPLSAMEYKIVAATTAVTGDGSQTSTTADWTVALVTYKGAAVKIPRTPAINFQNPALV